MAARRLVVRRDLRRIPVRRAGRPGGGVRAAPRPRHFHSPTSINYRANIDALKRVGVTDILSLSACGSLREDLPPGHFMVVDQFIDRTFARDKSFFGEGLVAHVSMAQPTCNRLAHAVHECAKEAGFPIKFGGTYIAMEGPQFSSLAESKLYRSWGCDVIGMTNMPEAKLAREAEICYATIAMVTDYDCWHAEHSDVDVAAIIKVLHENVAKAHALIERLARTFPRQHPPCPVGSDRALDVAIITPPEARDA